MVVSALDEAGAPTKAYQITSPGDRVLILGASGKSGALVAHAVHKKLQGSGSMVGIVVNQFHLTALHPVPSSTKSSCWMPRIQGRSAHSETTEQYMDAFDVVINCVNKPGTELMTLLAVKQKGAVFFATMGSDYKLSAPTVKSRKILPDFPISAL